MDLNFPSYLEYVPMLWGASSGSTKNWNKNVQNAISRGTKAVLAFNEPDACGNGQSCISPLDASRAYYSIFNLSLEVGTGWLMEFLALCQGCTIDFIPIHIYNRASNIAYYKNHMKDIATKTGRPTWLTELSARENQTAFLETLMPWMDAQPWIERYSWFWCSGRPNGGSTCGPGGYATALGQVYEFY